MLKTESSNLPAEQRARLHPDFLENERHYIAMRGSLLKTHPGLWVAVDQGKVVAASGDLMEVFDAVDRIARHAYVAIVGAEDEVVFRVRRAISSYDGSYKPCALPRIPVRFMNHAQTHSREFEDVIPDTGSDLSVLPAADCASIRLFDSPSFSAMTAGAIGWGTPTLIYRASAEIDGHRTNALVQSTDSGAERIVGRDVLNRHRILFDGPARQVIVNP